MTDFYPTLLRHDGHQAQDALGLAGRQVNDAVTHRIITGGIAVQPDIELLAVGKGSVGQVVPERLISLRPLQDFP
jgi:hypothetical protein